MEEVELSIRENGREREDGEQVRNNLRIEREASTRDTLSPPSHPTSLPTSLALSLSSVWYPWKLTELQWHVGRGSQGIEESSRGCVCCSLILSSLFSNSVLVSRTLFPEEGHYPRTTNIFSRLQLILLYLFFFSISSSFSISFFSISSFSPSSR